MSDNKPYPQADLERLIIPQPVGTMGTDLPDVRVEMLEKLDEKHVLMMGDNPSLPRMPDKPTLQDFFNLRMNESTRRHLLESAKRALDDGHDEKVVLACMLHDITNASLIRVDHGYWGAQLIAPYVDEEIAWAVKYHQALRYTPDPELNYEYPELYRKLFGEDYEPPEYIKRDAAFAMQHKWYMTSRYITLYDIYFFDELDEPVTIEEFDGIIARNFRQPVEGLGFDDSPSSHMWRTMIWPNNFL
ncbi:MAG: hypothetical protein P8M72_04010 [Gammaproteobacteria bacterium]|nr:hypothetical protein [Gammaproteobacteria bacterium]